LLSKIRNKHNIDSKKEANIEQYMERKVEQFFAGSDQSEKRLIELKKEISNAVKLFRASLKPQEKRDQKSKND